MDLRFKQWYKNTAYHEATKNEPYKEISGIKPRIRLAINILASTFLTNIKNGINEEELRIGTLLKKKETVGTKNEITSSTIKINGNEEHDVSGNKDEQIRYIPIFSNG